MIKLSLVMLPRSLAPSLDLKWENIGSELTVNCWTSPKRSCGGDFETSAQISRVSEDTQNFVLELLTSYPSEEKALARNVFSL